MVKGKKYYTKKQKGGSVIGDQASHVWKLLKKVGKATAVASRAIPAAVLTSQVAFAAFLNAQPDNGVAFLEKSAN
jgi:hypothetical protein